MSKCPCQTTQLDINPKAKWNSGEPICILRMEKNCVFKGLSLLEKFRDPEDEFEEKILGHSRILERPLF